MAVKAEAQKPCRAYSARKKPLYHNCQLQAPDSQLLCTCDESKANWYIDKGLGGQLFNILPVWCYLMDTKVFVSIWLKFPTKEHCFDTTFRTDDTMLNNVNLLMFDIMFHHIINVCFYHYILQ